MGLASMNLHRRAIPAGKVIEGQEQADDRRGESKTGAPPKPCSIKHSHPRPRRRVSHQVADAQDAMIIP